MIQLAKRTSYKIGEDLVFQVGEPTDSSLKTLNYKDKYETVTYNDYSNGIGREPTSNETYLVSSKTLLDVSYYKEENGLYYYTLNLNPELAGINYRKEIAYVSGVDVNTIEFISINISFVVDKNFNLISHTTTDNYTMKYAGIKVSVNGNYSINF